MQKKDGTDKVKENDNKRISFPVISIYTSF